MTVFRLIFFSSKKRSGSGRQRHATALPSLRPAPGNTSPRSRPPPLPRARVGARTSMSLAMSGDVMGLRRAVVATLRGGAAARRVGTVRASASHLETKVCDPHPEP